MAEDKQKKLRLLAYWLFTSVMIIFAAITAYIYVWIGPLTGTIGMAIKGALPITLVAAVAAAILYAVYYFLIYKKG